MRTKAEAEAVLRTLPLSRTVAVADISGGSRRRYTYTLPAGNLFEIEIDGLPSDRQISDLVRHLPLTSAEQVAALEAVRAWMAKAGP